MINVQAKLLDKLIVSDRGCWEFTGCIGGSGYGIISWGKRKQRGAHVISYLYHVGPIPKGLLICHKCDNTICCNPNHLFVGTHQDNVDDEVSKGRHVFGEKVGNSKLTEDNVREIKHLLKNTGLSQVYIAEKFGVTPQNICRIKYGHCWKHVQ